MPKHLSTAVAALVLVLIAHEHPYAQNGAPTRVPAMIVLSDQNAAREPFVIQRRGIGALDVIVLRSDATADQLSDAVRVLVTIRKLTQDTAVAPAMLRFRRQQATAHAMIPWVGRVYADVHAAAFRDVPGFGQVRGVQIWLPAQRRGGHAPQS